MFIVTLPVVTRAISLVSTMTVTLVPTKFGLVTSLTAVEAFAPFVHALFLIGETLRWRRTINLASTVVRCHVTTLLVSTG
jgi:hypothetical protein